MSTESLKSGRRRRTYTPQFKADMVAQCLQGDVSLASLAVEQGMNPNVLHRWVLEHQRYGKHSLPDEGNGSPVAQIRDMSPANWIPVRPPSGETKRQVVSQTPDKIIDAQGSAQANGTIALELAARGIHLTLQWPGHDVTGLAQFTRAVLT